MPSPLSLTQGVSIRWTVPVEISGRVPADIDLVKVFRSNCENTGYVEIARLRNAVGGTIATSYYDPTGNRGYYYLVTFCSTQFAGAPPANVAIGTTGEAQVTLSWTASTDASGVVGYRVTVATDNLFANLVPGFESLNVGNTISTVLKGLATDTNYFARVVAYDKEDHRSAPSATVAIRIVADDTDVPTAPTHPAASGGAGVSISFGWDPATDNIAVVGYRCDVATDNAFANIVPGYENRMLGNVVTATLTGLPAGNTYFVRIRAYDAAGNASLNFYPTWITSQCPQDDVTAPSVPTAFSYESSYHVTFYEPLPRELRLIYQIRSSMPDILNKSTVCSALTDNDYLAGLNLALGIFNSYPPETGFTLESFPKSHEFFLIGLASMTTIASRYLPVSIRDWSYAEPGGVSMTLDRGAKMNAAIQVIANVYTQYLPLLKLDFGHDMPCGLGTIQLPLSMGGVVSRGLLNVLDIFTATGR